MYRMTSGAVCGPNGQQDQCGYRKLRSDAVRHRAGYFLSD